MKTSFVKYKSLRILIAALVLVLPIEGHTCDQIFLDGGNVNLVEKTTSWRIRVRQKNNSGPCRFYVGIDRGQNNNGTYSRFLRKGSEDLPFQIFKEDLLRVVKDYPDSSNPNEDLIPGEFTTSGGNNEQEFFVFLSLGTVPYDIPAGNYKNRFRVKLYTEKNSGIFDLVNDRQFQAQAKVRPRLDVSLVASGGSFDLFDTREDLEFGELQSGKTRSFDLIVGNNSPFQISFQSTHNGNLRLAGGGSGPAENQPFRLEVGASSFSSAFNVEPGNYPYSTAVISPPTGNETRFPVTVRLLNPAQSLQAGSYSDAVYITLTAN